MPLVKRLIKGSPLTFAEGDANLTYLEDLATNTGSFAILGTNLFNGNQTILGYITALSFTGSFTGSLSGSALNATSASYALSSSYASGSTSSSYAVTSSYANNFLVKNTLTVQTLVVEFISSSITYSSGSNKFGDQTSDTQTFTGSVGITGSLSSIGALQITNDISASGLITQLDFGPGTQAGSNLFLQTSGSSGTNALEIRPYIVTGTDSQSYNFRQPLKADWGQAMTFDKNNASITIQNGNSDGGFILSRPTANGNESRLTSGPGGTGNLGFMTFYTGGSEKARINGSGSLLVGTTTSTGHATIINGTNTANFPSGALYVNGSSSFTGSLNLSGSLTVTTIGIELQVTNTGVKIGNMPTDTHPMTGSLNISGSVNISNVLQLSPLNPLPAAASFPNSFAVSASAPNKPYFSDGTNWNALY
jgi:hypothetical protein